MSVVTSIANFYLYGQSTLPENLINSSLIREGLPDDNVSAGSISVDRADFMSTAGRFAVGAQFELIKKFFDSSTVLSSGTYTMTGSGSANIFTRLGLSADPDPNTPLDGAHQWTMLQRDFKDGLDDLAERTFAYNNSAFAIRDGAQFIVEADGTRRIDNLIIAPYDDNFDLETSDLAARIANYDLMLQLDPSGIGRKIEIEFTGNLTGSSYTQVNYNTDVLLKAGWQTNAPTYSELVEKMNSFLESLFDGGTIKFLDDKERPILFDGRHVNFLNANNALLYTHLADYAENGVVLIGADGNDTLLGGDYTDLLIGGVGADWHGVCPGPAARHDLTAVQTADTFQPHGQCGGEHC